MFTNRNEVFVLNIEVGDIKTIYKFKNPLKRQPVNFDVNDDQTIFVIASADDGLYINNSDEQKVEVDIDELYNIGLIKNIKFESETREFYILCNREGTELGFYVLKFSEKDIKQSKFLIKFQNKLDIGDVEMFINYRTKKSREMIVGYKTIFINIYTIVIMDITTDSH